jgi:glycylpeptide N-tetradecanoyltransferase
MRTFWDKQPVPQDGLKYEKGKEIEKEKKVVTESIKLPDGFSWKMCSVEEAHSLLRYHYICDEVFRLNYSIETLKWAANKPGYESIGIVHNETNETVGFISSIPEKIRVCDDVMKVAQINFLCVHSKFRKYGFAPILISEIKRIANMNDVWRAIYTATVKIPTPVTKSNYWHRLLNISKLVKSGFHKTDRLREKYFEVRGNSQFRKMQSKDIPRVTKILQNHFKKFKIAPVIDKDWVKHWLLPIHSYINDEDNTFISFYEIPYERVDETHTVKQAYSFYVVGDVYNDAFLIAKNLGYDTFNVLDIGQDVSNLEKHKFIRGNGSIYYYLFNWLPSSEISLEDVEFKIP